MGAKAKRVIFYSAGALAIVLLIAILIPNFVGSRFVFHEFLTIKVQVTDGASGAPVKGAEIWIRGKDVDIAKVLGLQGQITDTNGLCEFLHGFMATGTLGRSGKFHIGDRELLVVKATGFKLWQEPLDAVFGKSRDYYNKDARVLSCGVVLEK